MNYCVNTIKYGYFTLQAARVRFPRSLPQFITILQLIQMIIGCIINITAFNYKQQGYLCATSYNNIRLSLLMYASYHFLLAHLLYKNYLCPDSMKKLKDRAD